jgi:hypothetical protein
VQTGANTFRLQFDRAGMGGAIWIQEEHPGNDHYRRAVQPGQIMIPARLTEGKMQQLQFPTIANQVAGTKTVPLKGASSSGLPVNYYVVSGPAVIVGDKLHLTAIPVKSKYPVKVTVVAYQWGRSVAPLNQSAELVEQTFFIVK